MSKIGVGVGDEFPVDDGNNPKNTNTSANRGDDDRAEFEEWKRRRDAWRAQKEQWRAQREEWHRRRHEWKEQWRDQKRAFRDDMRARFGDDYYNDGGRRYGRGRFHFAGFYGLPRILGIILVVAIVIFAISHIGYILAGLAAIALLWAAYHHFGHDPLDLGPFGPRDYGRPINNPPPAPTPSVPKPADNSTNNTGNTTT